MFNMGLLDQDVPKRFTPKKSRLYVADNAYKSEEQKLNDLNNL